MSSAASRLSQLRGQGGFFFLGTRARVRVTGADRLRYLNGQLSNDLRALQPGEAIPALLLTAKGKLCADLFVWMEGEALVVDAEGSLRDGLLARLERYAVSDDVGFESLGDDEQQCHIFGSVQEGASGIRIRRLGVAGVDLNRPPKSLTQATADEVELLRIERGIPRWGSELSEDTLPQEAALDRTAVDFRKGCYVGQEVVSRIHSIGRVNRQLCGLRGNFDPVRGRGAALVAADGEKAGRLTSAAYHPDLETTVSLGYIQTQSVDMTFSVVDQSGACLGLAERSQFPMVSL